MRHVILLIEHTLHICLNICGCMILLLGRGGYVEEGGVPGFRNHQYRFET